MDLDRLLHPTKTFAELADVDLEQSFVDRSFRTEHLNLEFKRSFPERAGKYDIHKICKYIAGFSNEEGGIVIYGVSDDIKNSAVPFPDYVVGLTRHPSIEDLSQWVTERVAPLVQSPAIREFAVAGRKIIVLKIPQGVRRPYAYVDPGTGALTFFKKTAGGLTQLKADEVRELYWSAILEQSQRILQAGVVSGRQARPSIDDVFSAHRKRTIPLLEDVGSFGRIGIYCVPSTGAAFSVPELEQFLEHHRNDFSEAMRFAPSVEVFQTGVSAGFFPRAIRQDIKSTVRVTLYTTGFVAFDSQADSTMDRDSVLHPYWLSYELQRHLQLAKALLDSRGPESIAVHVEFEGIENFELRFGGRLRQASAKYTGAHQPILRNVRLDEIHSFDGPQRNVVFPAVREIMDEVSRIFGLSATPPGVWDTEGRLKYVQGLESQR